MKISVSENSFFIIDIRLKAEKKIKKKKQKFKEKKKKQPTTENKRGKLST